MNFRESLQSQNPYKNSFRVDKLKESLQKFLDEQFQRVYLGVAHNYNHLTVKPA